MPTDDELPTVAKKYRMRKPQKLNVPDDTCRDKIGQFVCKTGEIPTVTCSCCEKTMHPAQFEAHAGMASAKKWKNSLHRLSSEDADFSSTEEE